MADYRILLGTQLDTSDIVAQINEAERKINPIKIKVDAETKELTKTIQDALKGLSSGTKNALTLDTTKLESSLNDVTSTIKEIKMAMGSLDSGSGMKSLVSSINSISVALDKASNKFDELVGDLKSLSGKDFSLNFGINLGGSNPIARQSAYGNKARNDTLPQLKHQMNALVKYYNDIYKDTADEFAALQKLVSGTKLSTGDFFQNFMFGKDSVASRMSGGSLSSQMQAYKQYIDMFKQAASLKGLDVSSVTSQFSKTADQLIQDAQDIQTGAKEMDESFEKLKQIFGGGNNLNIEGISAQLDSIVVDLGEIRTALQGLSSGVSLDGITSSFDRLSNSIENLLANAEKVKGVLNSGFDTSNSGSTSVANADSIKSAQQTGRKIGEAVKQSVKQSLTLDDVIDEQVQNLMNQYGIVGKKGSQAFEEIKQALVEYRMELTSLKSTASIDDDFIEIPDEDDAADIRKVTDALAANMKIADQTADVYEDLAEYIRRINNSGHKVYLPDTIKQEYGEDFSRMRSQLGKAFTTSQSGVDFESWVRELNDELGNVIDLSHGAEAAFGDLVNKVQMGRDTKYLSGDDLIKSGMLDMDDMEFDVINALGAIEEGERQLAQASAQSTNAVVQNEEKKQQAYRETADAVEQISNNKTVNAGQFDDDTADAKQLNVELKKLKDLAHQIGQLDFKIVKSDYNDEINQVREFERQLELLKKRYSETIKSLSGQDVDIGSIATPEFVEARNKIAEFEAKIEDTKRKLSEKLQLKLETGDFSAQVAKVESDAEKLSNTYEDVESGIKEVNAALNSMQTASADGDIERLINANKEYEDALKKVENQLKQNKIAEQNASAKQKLDDDIILFQSKIDSWLTKNSAATKQFGSTMLDLKARAEGCDRVTLNHLEAEFKQVDKAADAAGKKAQTFGDSLKAQFSKYSSYFSVASLFMYVEQGLRSMFEQVKLIDSAMTELKKVTDETDASYNKFLSNAATRSREIGTTIDGLVSSTADFARLGYGFEDAQGLAEVANIYAVVGDEIEGVEGATESLISTMAAFKGEMGSMSNTDFAMSIIDKFNEIGNNFAISSGGIGEAMERSASSLMAANNTIDESISLITAANEVVQNPEKVGNAMKTISMRIRGAKTE